MSDVWWVAHHLGKLSTAVPRTVASLSPGAASLDDGTVLRCDVVIACVGFTRNTTLCEKLTGVSEVMETNYLAPNLMYLADAEIDADAFNYFFGSSVLEYAKFYANVFAHGVANARADPKLAEDLWGDHLPRVSIHDRKWTQYINAARRLIPAHPEIKAFAKDQVAKRTTHLWGSYPPKNYVAANRREWVELHTRLNNGTPLPQDKVLPYFFDEAPAWCGPAPK